MEKAFFYILLVTTGLTVAFGYLFYRELTLKASEAFAGENNCVPYNLDVTNIAQTEFTVEWSTTDKCSSYLIWGDSTDDMTKMAVGENSLTKVDKQNVTVKDLIHEREYYLYIVSGDTVYGDSKGRPISVQTEKY